MVCRVALSALGNAGQLAALLLNRIDRVNQALDERGLFVAGFFFPVVPKGQARIRTQMSAALTEADIDFAIAAFTDAGKTLGIV